MSTPANSPLRMRHYDLEYPRSLGTYTTYEEVQSVVDALADATFPVQHTMIVGTDLKLVERVTGRKTWGRVLLQGVLSGVWIGLFIGVLFSLFTPQPWATILTSVVMGAVFFTVWALIGYAMTGGKRDFTSMVATVPMQYELMVEHKHADEARRVLAEHGASLPAPGAGSLGTGGGRPAGNDQDATSPPVPARPSYGQSAQPAPRPTGEDTDSGAAGIRDPRRSYGRSAEPEPRD
ncbi:MAG: hypothetical protein Q4G40_07410 [Brachybacterium sp.]|nr:hypothetical protein [Brachybacterium sp.]